MAVNSPSKLTVPFIFIFSSEIPSNKQHDNQKIDVIKVNVFKMSLLGQLYLYNSTVCRLCGERSQNGIKLFMSDERDVSQLINRYLPLKVSITCNT